ncbi:FAD linked oxidase [Naegleria gruberi]|uniref:FAD linked oxidase n=1 Tax=Naegleria gruberi TaxID=5762 RepID=D2VQF0_NAEGR|nr:FAD linked oxidase [Naegleria gruberi]EFC40861.1 FAD linked oxidase [Naegleria gruberi]|eukprot:XP_002673605.1 FAD linked oxidase [Naegleria gruberi strain NEG-M]
MITRYVIGKVKERISENNKKNLEDTFARSRKQFLEEKEQAKSKSKKNDKSIVKKKEQADVSIIGSIDSALKGACFPDPDPKLNANVYVDDVARLNMTNVKRVFHVRNEQDIQRVFEYARRMNFKVSMRGTQHCMGGHTIAKDGLVIDTRKLLKMEFDSQSETVRVGAGVRWSDLIFYLNQFGMSPHTMQSYSTFSVSGTVSCNAHGITTDLCSHESVLEMRVVMWDGRIETCTPDSELFKCCIGGFGMFGFISELVLKCVPNHQIFMEMIQCKANDFLDFYERILQDPQNDINIKLARLDISNFNDINIFVFRKNSDRKTVSDLPLHPKTMSIQSQIIYKWLAPSAGSIRYSVERLTGRPADWSVVNDRNLLMYETSTPLAKLYSPLFDVNDTFILQEYFVPHSKFQEWIMSASKIIQSHPSHLKQFTLLNITIRYVKKDNCTFLPYGRHDEGSFAFVLYYRMKCTDEADRELATLHNDLVEATLKLNGIFYLPYRHHYSDEQLKKAYPMIDDFFKLKAKYDPRGMFDSLWFNRYGKQYFEKYANENSDHSIGQSTADLVGNNKEAITELIKSVETRRNDSYRKVFNNPQLRKQFYEAFLEQIFNVESKATLENVISSAMWNIKCQDDSDIYSFILQKLSKQGLVSNVLKLWRGSNQNRSQKKELLRETSSILSKIGKMGSIRDYVSIGDSGKMVLAFKECLGIDGNIHIVNDNEPSDENMGVYMERGSLKPVGKFVKLNYSCLDLESSSADMVTMNQGLHHIPPQHLQSFLKEVFRILRPGGIFIVREHDATPELKPLLDIAHSVFNAVMNVDILDERNEVRAFRSILEWRTIVESVGFLDTMIYEMEHGDPTLDEMMAFCKCSDLSQISEESTSAKSTNQSSLPPKQLKTAPEGSTSMGIALTIDALLAKVPNFVIEFFRKFVSWILGWFKKIPGLIEDLNLSSMVKPFIDQILNEYCKPIEEFLEKLVPLLLDVKIKEDGLEIIPPELFLLIEGLYRKKNRSAVESLIVVIIDSITGLVQERNESSNKNETITIPSKDDVDVKEVTELMKKLFERMPDLLSEDKLKRGGLGNITPFVKAIAMMTPEEMAPKLVSFLDIISWSLMKEPLLEIIESKKEIPLSMDNICKVGNPWNRCASAFLSSPNVKLNKYSEIGWWALGLTPILNLWKEAQQERCKQNEKNRPTRGIVDQLSTSAETMLESAVGLSFMTGDQSQLSNYLKETNILKVSEANTNVEFNWYKLVEWLQVDYVQTFGKFMENTPWYRFPFIEFLRVYFQTLYEEFKIINSEYGFDKSLMSSAFFTDLIPGVAMTVLMGQMQALAIPLKMGLGETASKEVVSGQVETILITLVDDNPMTFVSIDDRIIFETIVPGLFQITVPTYKPFSDIIMKLARQLPESSRILAISHHEQIQLRVKTPSKEEVHKMASLEGCNVKFTFELPTDGTEQYSPSIYSSVEVKTIHLLQFIRTCNELSFEIIQIFDFCSV